jgi:hypothetical protein
LYKVFLSTEYFLKECAFYFFYYCSLDFPALLISRLQHVERKKGRTKEQRSLHFLFYFSHSHNNRRPKISAHKTLTSLATPRTGSANTTKNSLLLASTLFKIRKKYILHKVERTNRRSFTVFFSISLCLFLPLHPSLPLALSLSFLSFLVNNSCCELVVVFKLYKNKRL